MDFDQLQTFLEVARHASFSRAAEKEYDRWIAELRAKSFVEGKRAWKT